MSTTLATGPLKTDRILRIAQDDAARMYSDLELFRITIRRQPDGWHVEFDPDSPEVQGSGPHYVIDPMDGTILRKTYYQ